MYITVSQFYEALEITAMNKKIKNHQSKTHINCSKSRIIAQIPYYLIPKLISQTIMHRSLSQCY